jgi:tetratricopeptide (TPR) repeat protein
MSCTKLIAQADACLTQHRYGEAESIYEQCLQIDPTNRSIYWHLGLAQLLQDCVLEAQTTWLSVLVQADEAQSEIWLLELIEILSAQAIKYQQLGDRSQAETIYQQILEQAPEFAPAYANLGNIFLEQENLDEAIKLYQQALELNNQNAESQANLGRCYFRQENYSEAITHYYEATRIIPEDLTYRKLFANCLKYVSISYLNSEAIAKIQQCLETPRIDKNCLLPITLKILKLDVEFSRVLEFTQAGQISKLEAEYREGKIDLVINEKLFQTLLSNSVLFDPQFEILLTNLRRLILFDFLQKSDRHLVSLNLEFVCALALQCFNNEYVFYVSAPETDYISELKQALENWLTNLNSAVEISYEYELRLAIFGMYFPLYKLEGSRKLLEIRAEAFSDRIRGLVKRLLLDHATEAAIKPEIVSATPIHDTISLLVQSQYEQSPYPRWLDATILPPRPLSSYLKQLFPHFQLPEFVNSYLGDRNLQVLVAGCGTGAQPVSIATRFPDVDVLAVDLSLSSLAYASRMTRELEINNIVFQQADILALSNLEKRFDLIFCAGVLHHLDNPIDGWKVLINLLEPSGLMLIGLYSQKARRAIKAAQEIIQDQGFDSTPSGIRECRQAIVNSDADHPVKNLLRYTDFYYLSGCRDLIFHANEHWFTLPQIKEILSQLGLKFIGFELSVEYRNTYKAMFPEDINMDDILLWDQLEDVYPNTFESMYIFWCQKA